MTVVVDVMLPYYRPVESAWPAIQSVLDQSYPHWRLVVLDDAYPEDLVGGRLGALCDERVVYLRNEENIGLARNFSRCLSLVQAPYFVMLGDDDLLHTRFLASLVERIEAHPGIDIVQPGVRVIDADGSVAMPLADRVKRWLRPRAGAAGVVLEGERMAESLIRGDWAYFPSLGWRTETAKRHGFRDEYAVALDYGLLLDIALNDGGMLVYDEVVFDYRRHGASVSSAMAATGLRFAQEKKFLDAYAARMDAKGWHRAARIGRRRAIPRMNAAVEWLRALVSFHFAQSRVLWRYVLR